MSNESTEQRDFSADIDMIQEFKQREEQMQQELAVKQAEIDQLKQENIELRSSKAKNGENGAATDNKQYTKFLEQRIQECTEENKRYLAKYSDLRNFAYT